MLTKQFTTAKVEKVNVVGAQDKESLYGDLDFKEEAKYINREVAGFWAKGEGCNKDNWNSK